MDDLNLVRAFVDAINAGDIDHLVAMADPQIELLGPRGSAYGHQWLRDWMERANMTVVTKALYARRDEFVLAQHGTWHTPQGEPTSEAETFMRLRMGRDPDRITLLARYTTLADALGAASMTEEDAIAWE
jgi:hypothetical protein